MNKLFYKYGMAILIAILITACSKDNGSDTNTSITPMDNVTDTNTVSSLSIELVIGESVIINSGDRLSPKNEETEIEVEHILEDNIKRVTLLKGEATLIYAEDNSTVDIIE